MVGLRPFRFFNTKTNDTIIIQNMNPEGMFAQIEFMCARMSISKQYNIPEEDIKCEEIENNA